MKYFQLGCLVLLFSMTKEPAAAQSSNPASKRWTMVLPDGRPLGAGGIDSLERVWGKDRILFEHNETDDANGIMHVVRVTDEMYERRQLLKKQNEEALSAMLNRPAPLFALKDITGKEWSLAALCGKVVVLNFWFTSCGGCIQEMPELNKLKQSYDSANVVFLALTFNNAAQVRQFLQQRTFNYVVLPGSDAVDAQYNIRSWPTSIVIDRKGVLRTIMPLTQHIREELGHAIDGML